MILLVKCTALLVAAKLRNFAVMFCYFVIPPASVDWIIDWMILQDFGTPFRPWALNFSAGHGQMANRPSKV